MVALPGFRAVTLPSDTEATDESLLFQITPLLVALSGLTIAVNVSSSPSVSSAEVRSSDTLSTGYTLALTVTSQVAVLPPSSVLTVMVALPGFRAATLPSATDATEELLDIQITF